MITGTAAPGLRRSPSTTTPGFSRAGSKRHRRTASTTRASMSGATPRKMHASATRPSRSIRASRMTYRSPAGSDSPRKSGSTREMTCGGSAPLRNALSKNVQGGVSSDAGGACTSGGGGAGAGSAQPTDISSQHTLASDCARVRNRRITVVRHRCRDTDRSRPKGPHNANAITSDPAFVQRRDCRSSRTC